MLTIYRNIFFTLLAGCIIALFALPWSAFGIDVPFSGPTYKLGLDLQGGIELDYKIDLSEARQEEGYDANRKKSIIEGLKSIIDKRVETLRINDSVITNASYGGEEHIIVQIPLKGNTSLQNSENIQRAKEAIGKVVKIEFKELRGKATDEDRLERKTLAENIHNELLQSETFSSDLERFYDSEENVRIGTTQVLSDIFIGDLGDFSLDGISQNLLSANLLVDETPGYLIYEKQGTDFEYIFINESPSDWKVAFDSEGRALSDKYFIKSSVQYNQAFQPMIELSFNNEGASIFGDLTKRLVGQPLAIFVGGELLTAPNINEPILSGRAVITGNYTPESATALSDDINIGVVPAPIYLTSERSIDARLGAESLQKIALAGAIGFITILLFLAYIYRLAGVIAGVTLFVYAVLILAIVKQLSIVLTLASIAGLVLSLGIAIDANILIFERVKDALKKGDDLMTATKDGFAKSFSAIWDANLTGFIVSAILFFFGVNLIKGFGLMLGLGIVLSLFTVYFISRSYVMMLARSNLDEEFIYGKK